MSGKPNKKRKVAPQAGAVAGTTITDPRFTNIQSDPRYRLPGKKHKVKLDSRFSQALKDDDFSRRAKVDRYGRPLETDVEQRRLKRKYEFEDDESGDESDVADDDGEVQRELRKANETRDVLRQGKYSDSSSSSSSSDEDTDSEADDADEAELAPQTQNDVPTGEVSSRLAVVNLDWDNIRAQDLMAVFSSFLDSSSHLQHVAIYPSGFGKERLQREEMEGPPKEIFASSSSKSQHDNTSHYSYSSEDDEDEEAIKSALLNPSSDANDFDSTALRKYQIERMRYFYAILTFSSPTAAKQIYDAVDGTEYLSTANFFDLRFVPDDTDFSSDTPREECDAIPSDYKPNAFVTDALQHSKVKLTWDAEDTSRKEAVARAFRGGQKEIDENDLKAYLGSDSSPSDSEFEVEQAPANDNNPSSQPRGKKQSSRAKLRFLLGLAPDTTTKSKSSKGPVGNVQITFSAGLSGNSADGQKRDVFQNTEEEVNETTVEKYRRKEKERKARRRERARAAREGKPVAGEDEGRDDAMALDDGNGIEEDVEGGDEDLGFEDPFFSEPAAIASKAASKKVRKEERLKKKKEREEEEERDRKQRAQLELLMADEGQDNRHTGDTDDKKGVRHFDMRDIEKGEKAERKKNKKTKTKNKSKSQSKSNDANASAGTDDFKLNATDPRFASRLYENHEFAIDPTNPRYKGTKGMQALLEEGRRRKDKKIMRPADRSGKGDDDLGVKALVEKIKQKKTQKAL